MNSLQTGNLSFTYKKGSKETVFTYEDIQCSAKSPLLVSGKSGTGKTTFLHLLGGLLKPLSGSILIDQEDIVSFPIKKLDHFRGRHIGIIYQKPHFFQSLNVLDNILLAAHFSGNGKQLDRALSLAERLLISHLLHKMPAQLSLGEQQRLSVVRALLNSPKILLADEPTSSLDKENCVEVMQLLFDQSKIESSSLVIITHDERLQPYFKNTLRLT